MAALSFISRSVELQTLTWLRESGGLFDYDDPYLVKQTFSLSASAKVLRISDMCIIREENSRPIEDAKELGAISLGTTGSSAAFISLEEDDAVWQVVRSMGRCPLTEGDVYKVGRTLIEVVQISIFGYEEPKLTATTTQTTVLERKIGANVPCRICLCDQQTKEDPLLSPCLCSGTMGVIHLFCLREWLRSKLACSSSGKSTIYSWSPPLCELCKSELPINISLDNSVFSLMEVKQPNSPFLVLKVDNQEAEMVTVHVVSMNEGDCARIVRDTQGRGPKSDVRIDCRSLSRRHADIRFTAGEFLIVDRKSKYGTLVHCKGKVPLHLGCKCAVQIGRTVIVMRLRHRIYWKALCSCCRSAKVRPEPAYRLDDDSKDEVDRSDQNLIRRLNSRISALGSPPMSL